MNFCRNYAARRNVLMDFGRKSLLSSADCSSITVHSFIKSLFSSYNINSYSIWLFSDFDIIIFLLLDIFSLWFVKSLSLFLNHPHSLSLSFSLCLSLPLWVSLCLSLPLSLSLCLSLPLSHSHTHSLYPSLSVSLFLLTHSLTHSPAKRHLRWVWMRKESLELLGRSPYVLFQAQLGVNKFCVFCVLKVLKREE